MRRTAARRGLTVSGACYQHRMNKDEWQLIREVLGSVTSLISLSVVIWVTWRALPREMRKVRHQYVLQAHAGAATALWTACFDLLQSMEAVAHPGSIGTSQGSTNAERFVSSFAPRIARFDECANDFLRSWSIAELHFGEDVESLMKEVWKAKATIQVAYMMYVEGLRSESSKASDHEALFSEATRESFRALRLKAKLTLRPYALASKGA